MAERSYGWREKQIERDGWMDGLSNEGTDRWIN